MPLRIAICLLTTIGAGLVMGQLTGAPKRPVELKLLIVTGDGNEPGFAAMKSFCEHLGLPYEAVIAKNQALPALTSGSTGRYQGIVLITGNLAIFDGTGYRSALTPEAWTALDNYSRDFGVRTLSYYTFPEVKYGMTFVNGVGATDASPVGLAIPAGGQAIFSYLKNPTPVKIVNAYLYIAAPAAAAGETTTPILTTSSGQLLGVSHKKADGREYLALTFDNSPFLMHSLALNYGLINWVTRGVFLGRRRIYLTPQNDDLFLASDLFVANNPACQPVGAAADPTYDPATQCPNLRMTDVDLNRVLQWQNSKQASAQYAGFKLTMAFNAYGTTEDSGYGPNDPLARAATAARDRFFWVSHTYDHENLDCYQPVPNSGICRPATYAESVFEVAENIKIAAQLKLPLDKPSMVTPGISGLNNTAFLSAAAANGIKYLVTDTSRPGHTPAIPNTGIVNPIQPSILMIPRRATNIFYNASSARTGVPGSEPDEYNFLFGPNGYFRIGGSGAPFFPTTQSHSQIIARESDALITYMLRYEIYPTMYHQANFDAYDGRNSLFTDLFEATLTKFSAISNLPVASLSQTTIGQMLEERMAYLASGAQATWEPGLGVRIKVVKAAVVPLTGACLGSCETYGGQRQGRVTIGAGGSALIPVL